MRKNLLRMLYTSGSISVNHIRQDFRIFKINRNLDPV